MNKELIHQLKTRSKEISTQVIEWRRHLHAHPELSYQEHETARYVAERLTDMGLEPKTGIADTGIVVELKGKEEGPTVALRGDMDALPIQEQNEVSYKSKHDGVMHACGHDVHTSSLLGAVQLLNEHKDWLKGTIRCLFQPGEEKAPGGANLMIKEGVLENPRPKSILGQHVMPFIPAGKVGFCSGMYMASADELYITVKGKGGHGAMPQQNIDPVLASAHMITALQQVVSRRAHPNTPSVLSIGKVIANGATNVIPDEVYLEGTFRTLNDEWREEALKIMEQIARGSVESMGCELDFNLVRGYPYLENDPELSKRARAAAEDFLGKEHVLDLEIWLAAEDFAFYTKQIPGCFYRLGTGNDALGTSHSVHTPQFNIDESALELAPGLMAWLAIQELEHAQQ